MKRCIACGAPLWETPLLTLDNMPASAQHMPDAQGVKQDRGTDPGFMPVHGLRTGPSLTVSRWTTTGM